MYERIKKWYKMGLWTETMVRTAVDKNILTAKQADEILA